MLPLTHGQIQALGKHYVEGNFQHLMENQSSFPIIKSVCSLRASFYFRSIQSDASDCAMCVYWRDSTSTSALRWPCSPSATVAIVAWGTISW